jgi:hypothetical protein
MKEVLPPDLQSITLEYISVLAITIITIDAEIISAGHATQENHNGGPVTGIEADRCTMHDIRCGVSAVNPLFEIKMIEQHSCAILIAKG